MIKESTPETSDKCSLCGHHYNGFAFKGGYVCENCLDYIKYDEPIV